MSRADELRFEMFNLQRPADPEAIVAFEVAAGFALPGDYGAFLRKSNGGWGEIGAHFLQLWPVEALRDNNRACRAAERAPGLLLFGSNGSGDAFAFDRERPGAPVVLVTILRMGRGEAIDIASTFGEFLERLHYEPDLHVAKPAVRAFEAVPQGRQGVAPYQPGRPGPWPSASIGAYLGRCRARFQTAQAELVRGHGIDAFDGHRYDPEAGRLDFLAGAAVALSFHVLPLGCWSAAGPTWRWAWDVPATPPATVAALAPLARLARDPNWPFFDGPQYGASLDNAWFSAMLALDVLGGQGVFRTSQRPEVFLLLTGLAVDNR
ncbi:MAG: SMI1/KNR4 family protein [Kiloniellales bacterium]|nr:SMI1/KNR4 family protein [Kiloniellales bacterium]